MVLNGSVAYVAFRLAAVLQQTFWALKVGIVNCQNTQYAGFFFLFQIIPVRFCHRQSSFTLVISNSIKPKSMQK